MPRLEDLESEEMKRLKRFEADAAEFFDAVNKKFTIVDNRLDQMLEMIVKMPQEPLVKEGETYEVTLADVDGTWELPRWAIEYNNVIFRDNLYTSSTQIVELIREPYKIQVVQTNQYGVWAYLYKPNYASPETQEMFQIPWQDLRTVRKC